MYIKAYSMPIIRMNVPVVEVFILIFCFVITSTCHQITFLDYCIDNTNPDPFTINGARSSGSIIMSKSPTNGSWYQANMNCSVTFSTENNYFLFLTFSNISLRNSSMDNLTVIYNGDYSVLSLSGQQVCSNENCEGLKFDSAAFNNLTLAFQSSNVTVPQNVTGFRAHYTVYSLVDEGGACRDRRNFLCENGHCIPNELVCDHHNNCGDRSDETKCVIPVPDTVWGIVVIVVAILCIFTFVPLFCCLAMYGTRSIVKTVTVATPATPLHGPLDCGETSGLLLSSENQSSYWPGTSYDRSNSFSYGTTHNEPSGSSEPVKKLRSMSEACQPQVTKVL